MTTMSVHSSDYYYKYEVVLLWVVTYLHACFWYKSDLPVDLSYISE